MFTEPVRRNAVVVLCVGLLIAATSCAFLKSKDAGAVIVTARAMVPASLVAQGLSIVAFQSARKLSPEVAPDKQPEAVQRVRAVIDKLLENEPELKKESAGWSIHIIDSDARDAVAFTGAGILVHRGLLDCDDTCLGKPAPAPPTHHAKKHKKPTEPGSSAAERVLAVALSHEISHLRGKHFEQRLKANAKLVEGASKAVQDQLAEKAQKLELPKSPEELTAALADIVIPGGALKQLLLIAGFSIAGETGGHPFMVDQELASDCQGSGLMQRAGYDPGDAIAFWSATGSVDSKIFFPTHPRTEERLSELKHCVAALKPDDKASRVAAVSDTRPRAKR